MPENPFTNTPPPDLDYAAIAKSSPEIISGARWFWWITGLSLVNSIILHSGGGTSFVIGLGFTQIVDAMFQSLKPVAFGIDLLALGFFFAMGWFAAKGYLWAFITGIVFYALDAVIYMVAQDWMPVGFHGLALFYLFRATMKLREEIKAARIAQTTPAAPPVITATPGV